MALKNMKEVLTDLVDKIEMHLDFEDNVTDIKTGVDWLDEETAGLRPSNIYVIASRPEVNGYVMALHIAAHVAIKEDQHVLIYSMMHSVQHIANILVKHIDHKFNTSNSSLALNYDLSNINHINNIFKPLNIHIDAESNLPSKKVLRNIADILSSSTKIPLVIVDGLQSIKTKNGQKPSSKDWQITMQKIRELCNKFNASFFVLTELKPTTQKYKWGDIMPYASDLPSLEIYNYSDVVIYACSHHSTSQELNSNGEIIASFGKNLYGGGRLGCPYFIW
ncbi:Replicative DNA helicase [Candidatus Brocadiaceae bacterium]|nr:Replicative DNA helicase [Candidatus Brocadiaceae bacterium]